MNFITKISHAHCSFPTCTTVYCPDKMSSWCLHEGAVGERSWRLSTVEELVVGRSVDCGVIVQSQSVENRHAMLKWDQKNLSYILKDLSSVNGTYVNSRPLRGTQILLKHNDAIRFGHDKDHVFRMEECFPPTYSMAEPSPVPRVPMSSTMSPPHTSTTSANVHSQHIPASVQSGGLSAGLGLPMATVPTTGLPMATVPTTGLPTATVPTTGLPTATVPTTGLPTATVSMATVSMATVQPAGITTQAQDDQSHLHSPHRHAEIHPIDHALPIDEDSVPGSPHRSDGRRGIGLEHSPALNKASKLYGQPNWWGEGEGEDPAAARDREFEFVKPGSQILRQFDVERKTPKLATKTDELRMLAIPMARPDHTSSWVVDFGGGAVAATPPPRLMRARERPSRPRSADPSPNRSMRRDTSPLVKRAATPTTKRHSSLSSSSQVSITPISPRKQRAATPPVSRQKQRAATPPVSRQKQRAATPPVSRQKQRAATPPASRQKQRAATPPASRQKQRAATPPVSRSTVLVSGRPPRLGSSRKQTAEKSHPTTKPPQSVSSNPGPPQSVSSNPGPPQSNPPTADPASLEASIDLKSLNEGTLSYLVREEQVRNDETYTAGTRVSSDDSFSSLSDHSPSESEQVHVVTGQGKERKPPPPTIRKQWSQEDTQSPDSLMMASIEARMRRLSRLTHQTARHVTTLRNSIQEGHQMQVLGLNYLSLRDTSPVVTRPEHNLPEWKFFNQEANSIFRNMRVVEKWLHDIDNTLESIQPVGNGVRTREVLGSEDIDGGMDKFIVHNHSASEEMGSEDRYHRDTTCTLGHNEEEVAGDGSQCSHSEDEVVGIGGTLTNLQSLDQSDEDTRPHPLDQSDEDTFASDGELYMDSIANFESASED